VNAQNAPNTLYSYSLDTEIFTPIGALTRSGVQWASILPGTGNLFGVQQTMVGGHYAFTVSMIGLDGTVKDIGTSATDDTYVNFFWADIDPVNSIIYVLSGDENSLFSLDATLYSFNLNTGAVSSVLVDNTAFTLSNLHVDPSTGTIYSITPGLFSSLNWTIVTVNPKTGAVTPKSQIANSNMFPRYYGGGVYNGLTSSQVFHTFQWANTGATALTVLDIPTGNTLYLTDINLGINSHGIINSVIAV